MRRHGRRHGPAECRPPPSDPSKPTTITLRRFDFIVQFCWQPKTPQERHKAEERLRKKPRRPAHNRKPSEIAGTAERKRHASLAEKPPWTSSKSSSPSLKKYQFWVLCGVMLLTTLVCWWLATSGLASQFQDAKAADRQRFHRHRGSAGSAEPGSASTRSTEQDGQHDC